MYYLLELKKNVFILKKKKNIFYIRDFRNVDLFFVLFVRIKIKNVFILKK